MSSFDRCLLAMLLGLSVVCPPVYAAEWTTLREDNWSQWVPEGKEVDCIYGDIVLRNDTLVAVIGRCVTGRDANMTVRNVAGSVIDLTQRQVPNDQLSAFYPGGGQYPLTTGDAEATVSASGREVRYHCRSSEADGEPRLDVVYRLVDGEPWLHVETTYTNPHAEAITVVLHDAVRADRSFDFTFVPDANLFLAEDDWWHQTYALVGIGRQPVAVADSVAKGRPMLAWQQNGSAELRLEPGETYTFVRDLIPAANTLQLQGRLRQRAGQNLHAVTLDVRDAAGPVANARVRLREGDRVLGQGRTDAAGRLTCPLQAGLYRMEVEALGRPALTQPCEITGDTQRDVTLELPGYVRGQITDVHGRRIPCKVEFRGKQGTPDPYFGPDTYVQGIQNLVYSAHGQFRQEIAPGQYDVIVSHGPEYDAVFTSIEVRQGQDAILEARLRRSVETPGWVSSDFHSHSTPSGDNTSSQRGRVLNLLCEHLEFAPCTEHNRISSYAPHLKFFQAEHLMATCTGMELTGQPLPVNHQNAFPLIHRPRTQDGGAPRPDENPVVQIERLAFWDQRSRKVVQGNHPNLMQVLGDRDLDGVPDGGFERMLASMDVVEVHPPQDILDFPTAPPDRRQRGNVIYNWLQLLNQGYHIPGVVNTDAHYNFHGSGWLRNYLQSPTDDPADVTTADMVAAAESGHIIMTNGPYLEVRAEATAGGTPRVATAGDDLPTDDGAVELKIRVQCANWLNVNRVLLLFNGQPQDEYDFQRRTHPAHFHDEVVKFEYSVPLRFQSDTHVVVVAVGQGLKLGPVVGPDHQDDPPIAVANPIFVDVDSNGFRPNGDTLGLPLPIDTGVAIP